MNVGNQSTLNDLKDFSETLNLLDLKIVSKFEEAKQVNLGTVSRIQNGSIESGTMMQDRPIGVYHFDHNVTDSADFGLSGAASTTTYGCGLHMKLPSRSDYGILNFISWSGDAYLSTVIAGTQQGVYQYLTTKNTIVDANGFIKTA